VIRSGLRHAEVAPATQAGDDDRIINSRPSGIASKLCFIAVGLPIMHFLVTKENFLFGGISPPNKKSLLCGLSVSAVKILFWTRVLFRK
jgi:hypothetical protein